MSNKLINNLLKKMENNPNRYKPTGKSNKDDGQKYLKDLGKLLCVIIETDDDPSGSITTLNKIYTGNWIDIIIKLTDDDTKYNFDLEIDQKTNGDLYEKYDKNYKNIVSENDYYKTNPKLIFDLKTGRNSMYVVPISEVEDLDKNTTGGGRRRKTHKNKRK
jgi:hypothetical protein